MPLKATERLPEIVAVPLPLSTKVTPAGSVPLRVIAGLPPPLVVMVKVLLEPTRKVAALPLVMLGGPLKLATMFALQLLQGEPTFHGLAVLVPNEPVQFTNTKPAVGVACQRKVVPLLNEIVEPGKPMPMPVPLSLNVPPPLGVTEPETETNCARATEDDSRIKERASSEPQTNTSAALSMDAKERN